MIKVTTIEKEKQVTITYRAGVTVEIDAATAVAVGAFLAQLTLSEIQESMCCTYEEALQMERACEQIGGGILRALG